MDSPIVRSAPPTPDPLRDLPPPDPDLLGLNTINRSHWTSNPNGNRPVTLKPGIYPNGITLTGNTDGTNALPVTMEPGIYYLESGGFTVTGRVDVVADGVMIYNASPPSSSLGQSNGISISGGATLDLSPLNSTDPSASKYNGIAIYVNRDSGTPINLSGTSGTTLRGTVYAASSDVSITGNGDALIGWRYISRTLDVGGNGNLRITYDALLPPQDRVLQLVE
jgi:hypothetical protein